MISESSSDVFTQSAIPAMLGLLLFVHTFLSAGPMKLVAGFLGFASLATDIATAWIEPDHAADQHTPALGAMERLDLLNSVRLEAMVSVHPRGPESVRARGIALQALHARRVRGCLARDSLAHCRVSQTPT